jgi:DNA-binding NarL/FixJ family response regulator
MAGPIKRILIADDHDAVRRGVRTLLESRQDLRVVAEAANGGQALSAARETMPDIAIIDYSLPVLNGRELTVALRRELPRTEVLIYTMYDQESLVLDVLRAGARGFILKSETEAHLLAAIGSLSVHRPYFSSAVSEALLDQFLNARPSSGSGTLTRREREIVQLIAEGKINREIAELLDISVKTVETHRATAMHKLKLRTTADLVRYAVRNHIVEA